MDQMPPFQNESPPSLDAVYANRKAKWPKVIGIICIVMGAGGLLMLLVQQISVFVQFQQFDQMRDADIEFRDDLESDYRVATTILGFTTFFISGLLLTGGIMLLKRKKAAPVVLKIWAVLRIVVGGFAVTKLQLLTGEITKLAMELARAQQGGDPNSEKIFDAFGSVTEVMIKIGMVTGFVWLAALPVFILIWMSREKNKREIATW